MSNRTKTIIVVSALVIALVVLIARAHAQETTVAPAPMTERHETIFGEVIIEEIKRNNAPNLICYGQDNGKGSVILNGCALKD